MIEIINYILDFDDNFWFIYYKNEMMNKGYLAYKVSDEGKFNHITKKRYVKVNPNKELLEIPKLYKQIFKPREFYKENKNNLTGIWKSYVDVLNEIGISDNDIGIFGSYLIGFDITKDVDFVIYGKDNLYKYYENINYIQSKLGVTSISPEHIDYQYNKHKVNFSDKCDLKEIVGRNWSGIQLDNGVLSTPRFIDKDDMIIPLKKGSDKLVTVEVIEGIETAMLPRKAKVCYNNDIYTVYSPLWKFQSFAHRGDIIEIFGNVDNKNKLIILDDYKYYINYKYKTENIK